MTNITPITGLDIRRNKAALEAKLREMTGVSVSREDLQIEHLADPLDQLKSNLDRELTIERLDHQTRLGRDIQLALKAMEEGAYGVCERCEEPIPQRRLDAVPWARLCVGCQSEVEAAQREGNFFFEEAA